MSNSVASHTYACILSLMTTAQTKRAEKAVYEAGAKLTQLRKAGFAYGDAAVERAMADIAAAQAKLGGAA